MAMSAPLNGLLIPHAFARLPALHVLHAHPSDSLPARSPACPPTGLLACRPRTGWLTPWAPTGCSCL